MLSPIPYDVFEFLKIKETELRQYEIHVHPWERERYMENF